MTTPPKTPTPVQSRRATAARRKATRAGRITRRQAAKAVTIGAITVTLTGIAMRTERWALGNSADCSAMVATCLGPRRATYCPEARSLPSPSPRAGDEDVAGRGRATGWPWRLTNCWPPIFKKPWRRASWRQRSRWTRQYRRSDRHRVARSTVFEALRSAKWQREW
jgi:hypothetical protein